MRILLGLAVLAIMAAPVAANMLDQTSGSFEDPWPADGGGHVWQSTKTGDGILERNSGIFGPGAPACGSYWGSVQSGGGGTYYGWLQSIQVPPSESLTLSGVVAGGTNGANADLWIQILDGCSPTAPILPGQWRVNLPVTYGFGWTPFSVGPVHPVNGGVTIKFGITINSGWSNGTAIHLDCLDLVPEPASMGLFGLAGLPLLLRRRR